MLISRDGGTTWNGLNNFNNNYITGPNGNHEIIALPNDTGIVQFAFWANVRKQTSVTSTATCDDQGHDSLFELSFRSRAMTTRIR